MYKVIHKDNKWIVVHGKGKLEVCTISHVLLEDKQVAYAIATILNKNSTIIINLSI